MPLPVGFGFAVGPRTRALDERTLLGGTPLRVLRLSARGGEAWHELTAGTIRSRAGGMLARRLTDAGLGDPVPPAAPAAASDVTSEVTVVVPVRDRAAALDRCLSALGARHRVVVVDDGSSDPGSVAEVAKRHGAELVRREVNGGPGAARNTGLAAVSTDHVAFVDSDCTPEPGWLDGLLPHLADPLVAAVAPRIVAADSPSAAARYARGRGALDLGPRPGLVGPRGRVAYVPTAALLARRSALLDVAGQDGVFDPVLRYGEDVDLAWRLRAEGWRVRYDPAVRVRHAEPESWPALLARRYHYGTSAAPLSARHPGAVVPLVLERWTALAVGALALRRPGVAVAFLAGALTDERQARSRAELGAEGTVPATLERAARTWQAAGSYAAQFLAPALLCAPRRARWALAALMAAPPAVAWWRGRPHAVGPLTFAAAHVAEDVAYGAGVVAGCVRARTAAPLRPVVVRKGVRE